MAGTISLTCPKCGKKVKVRAELEGKKMRCKDCGTVYPVKIEAGGDSAAASPAKTKTTTKAKQSASAKSPKSGAADDDSNPYGITKQKGDESYRCPICANEMESPD